MNDTTKIAVTYVNVDKLKPLEGNPRYWSEFEKKNLKKSLDKYSFVDPLVVNSASGREEVVLGGNFRLAMAKELGIKEVPCVYVRIDDRDLERELSLRLNRNQGSWDMELLKQYGVDMLLEAGFDDLDLSHVFDEQLEVENDDFNVEKELEKIGTPQTQPGDMFLLGNHKLFCGDATDFEAVKKLTQGEKITIIYTDPPFNIGLDYNKGIGAKGKYGGAINDNKSDGEYEAFLRKTIQNALSVLQPEAHVFYYCDQRYIGLLQQIYRSVGIDFKRVCLWLKNNANVTPQIAFNKIYEPCVYGTRGKPFLNTTVTKLNEVMNQEVSSGNRLIDDVLDLLDIWLVKRLPTQSYEHPTEKPPTLHEKALRRCTRPGDTVLDLFGGSGSLLLTCEQLKRKSLLMEVEPIFCDLIIKRYEQYTNGKAVKVS